LQKQKSTKVPLEKVEVRYTKDGKGSCLFAMENIDKDDYVIEYLGKIEYPQLRRAPKELPESSQGAPRELPSPSSSEICVLISLSKQQSSRVS
jgi:hypothetical protein